MTCMDARLEEYLDGELAAADRASTEAHLTSCADCRAELERLRKLEEILRRVPAGAPPDADRFLAGIRARSRRPSPVWRFAAAAAVILGLGLLFIPKGSSPVLSYLQAPSPELEQRLREAGPSILPDVEAFLASSDAKIRAGAASLLIRLLDPSKPEGAAILARVSSRFPSLAREGWVLEKTISAYLGSPRPDLEQRLKDAGPVALAAVEARLADPDVKTQFAAASLLFRLLDPSKPEDAATLARVSARFQAPAREGWILADLGAEEEDVETVPIALLALETGEAWGVDALRHLNRMHKAAQQKVVGAVVTLLKSDKAAIQKRALEIVKELDIEFPLTSVVDLLDSPELGEEALRILRRATGKDYGRDKRAWLKALTTS